MKPQTKKKEPMERVVMTEKRHVLECLELYVNHLVSVEYNETLVYSRFLIDTLQTLDDAYDSFLISTDL